MKKENNNNNNSTFSFKLQYRADLLIVQRKFIQNVISFYGKMKSNHVALKKYICNKRILEVNVILEFIILLNILNSRYSNLYDGNYTS